MQKYQVEISTHFSIKFPHIYIFIIIWDISPKVKNILYYNKEKIYNYMIEVTVADLWLS